MNWRITGENWRSQLSLKVRRSSSSPVPPLPLGREDWSGGGGPGLRTVHHRMECGRAAVGRPSLHNDNLKSGEEPVDTILRPLLGSTRPGFSCSSPKPSTSARPTNLINTRATRGMNPRGPSAWQGSRYDVYSFVGRHWSRGTLDGSPTKLLPIRYASWSAAADSQERGTQRRCKRSAILRWTPPPARRRRALARGGGIVRTTTGTVAQAGSHAVRAPVGINQLRGSATQTCLSPGRLGV